MCFRSPNFNLSFYLTHTKKILLFSAFKDVNDLNKNQFKLKNQIESIK